VSKVVNPKVSKLLLEITGHETSWRKDAMTEEVERSCQALIGSAFLSGIREVLFLSPCRIEVDRDAFSRAFKHVH
jgi:hypothetical protein